MPCSVWSSESLTFSFSMNTVATSDLDPTLETTFAEDHLAITVEVDIEEEEVTVEAFGDDGKVVAVVFVGEVSEVVVADTS